MVGRGREGGSERGPQEAIIASRPPTLPYSLPSLLFLARSLSIVATNSENSSSEISPGKLPRGFVGSPLPCPATSGRGRENTSSTSRGARRDIKGRKVWRSRTPDRVAPRCVTCGRVGFGFRTSFLISKPGSRSIGQIRQIQLRIKSVEQLNFVTGDDPLGVWH